MSESRGIIPLAEARAIAERYRDLLAPSCERIEIAGSVRRECPGVHDIELCLVPKFEAVSTNLFGEVVQRNLLDDLVYGHGAMPKDGLRMKQILLSEGIALELYIVLPPAEWGALFTLRTGPPDYSHWLVTHKQHGGAMPAWLNERNGALWRGKEKIDTPTEEDFFRALGLNWIEPKKRMRPR